MTKMMDIKIDFDKGETKKILDFITNTKEGKFTDKKPALTQIYYGRIQIQEQEESYPIDACYGRELLFGIS